MKPLITASRPVTTLRRDEGFEMYRRSQRVRRASIGVIVGGSAAGLVGGLAGALVMNQVSSALQKLMRLGSELTGDHACQEESTQSQSSRNGGEENVSSTVEVAQAVSRTVSGREVPRRLQSTAGTIVHYAFGAFNGALYGALAVVAPGVTAGRGLLFGAGLWATADEAMLPLLRLSKPPTRYPASTHALALAGHLAFGLTVDVVRRALRGSRQP